MLRHCRLEAAEKREAAVSERIASLERDSGKSGIPDDLMEKLEGFDKRMQEVEKKLGDHDLVLTKVKNTQREVNHGQ